MVNLELYKVFYTVARCGSLTKAAQELYISQPAVSQAIKQLETQLGTPLFNRMHKGMELTGQGGALIYHDVEKALTLLEGVESRLSELMGSASGTLRIGASESIFQYLLSERIVAYRDMYPQVKIELVSDVTPKIVEYLKGGKVDVGFLNLPVPEGEEVRLTDAVMLLNDIFIAGKAYEELLRDRTLTIWDLQQFPLILLEKNTVARTALIRFAEGLGVRLQPAIEVDSWGFMKQLVQSGMGIGCIPRQYAKNRLERELLFELDVRPAMPSRSVGMALPLNSAMPFSLKTFIRMFEEER